MPAADLTDVRGGGLVGDSAFSGDFRSRDVSAGVGADLNGDVVGPGGVFVESQNSRKGQR